MKAWTFLALLLLFSVCAAGCDSGISNSGTCSYAGKRYGVGERFPDTDGCNSCECRSDGVACTLMACLEDGGPSDPNASHVADAAPDNQGMVTCSYAGKTYQVGDTFKDTEDCNGCRCTSDGLVACTVMACLKDAAPLSGDVPAPLDVVADSASPGLDSGPASCTYKGKVYAVGAFYPAADGCNECHCDESGQSFCTVVACAVDAAVADAGTSSCSCRPQSCSVPTVAWRSLATSTASIR